MSGLTHKWEERRCESFLLSLLLAYCRSIERFPSWKWIQVASERTKFVSSIFFECVWCLVVGVMFGQDVNVCSARRSVEDNSFLLHQMPKADNLVKTSKCACWEGATRRIVKRSYGSGWSTLCVFRHHLLKTLLFFHCSSRDVPHLRQTVRDEYSIALPSECVQ